MNIKSLKIIMPFFAVAILLLFISIINTVMVKGSESGSEERYKNMLSKKLHEGSLDGIDYNYLSNDLEEIDDILNDILSIDSDIKKKSEYYNEAQNIYDIKLNEITAILNQKLDDEDFENLIENIDEFYKNLDFATDEINNTIKSSVDSLYNTYKYLYEEKQKKCREILEEYKGFLSKS